MFFLKRNHSQKVKVDEKHSLCFTKLQKFLFSFELSFSALFKGKGSTPVGPEGS